MLQRVRHAQERGWAGCVPPPWQLRRGGLGLGVVWASGGPALAGAWSGVIFASAHPPPLSFSPLPPGPASPALEGGEQLELLRRSREIRRGL